MIQFLTFLTGVILAVMISINGNLSDIYGVFWATVIIHAVGSIVAGIMFLFQKERRPLWRYAPKWIYLGGVIGVFTTVANNLATQYISITSIIALGLMGQILAAICIDCLGLFEMKKIKFQKKTIVSIVFAMIGITVMLDSKEMTSLLGVLISLGAGVSVVLSRTENARLAKHVGGLGGALVNHLVGIPASIIVALFLANNFQVDNITITSSNVWMYVGGAMGVCVVFLCNITVPRIAAFQNTMLTFIGQMVTGVIIDVMMGKNFMDRSFVGGLIIAVGIAIHMMLERYWQSAGIEQNDICKP